MAREGGFSVDDEDVLETLVRMHTAAGEAEAASLIRSGRCRFELSGHDNWDGGTNLYTLHVEVAAESFVVLGDRRTTIEERITARLSEATKQYRSGWYSVQLAPLVVSVPARPDLQGGPVARATRRGILDMLRTEGVRWQGDLNDVEFLDPVFDLNTLPSGDYRFKTAAGDIHQHRFNNSDWPDDWIYRDDRFDLLDGPDVTFLVFVERLVAPTVRPDKQQAAALTARLNEHLQRSGWTLAERETLSGDVRYQAEPFQAGYLRTRQTLRTTAAVLSSAWMHQELERIDAAIDTDPALAIGTAKEMVETCCKHIADALGVQLSPNPDLPELTKAVLKALQLVPEGVPETAKGAETVRRTLSNLAQVTQGLAELRRLYGTGHGRSSTHRGLNARHARLAVGAAATFVEFVAATHMARLAETEKVP